MIKKELKSSLTKHLFLIIILIAVSLPFSINPGGSKPSVAICETFEFEEQLGESVNLRVVSSVEEGKRLIEKGDVDAFLFSEGGELILMRNGKSMNSLYARSALENIINPPQLRIEYINEELVDLFFFFTLLFSIISLGLPMLLFEDDHDVMDAILMSPMKTSRIPLDKAAAAMIITSAIILVYLFITGSLRINTLIVALSIGFLFVSLGTVVGVLGKKNVSWLVMLPAMMVLIIPNRISNVIRAQIEATQFSPAIPYSVAIYIILSVFFLGLASLLFRKINERRRVMK